MGASIGRAAFWRKTPGRVTSAVRVFRRCELFHPLSFAYPPECLSGWSVPWTGRLGASKAMPEQDSFSAVEVHSGIEEGARDLLEAERRVECYRGGVASVCEVPRFVRMFRDPVETRLGQRSRTPRRRWSG